jgi:hypothetical protein
MSKASRLADRTDRLGTETAFEVRARANSPEAKERRITHVEIGEPDFNTAEQEKLLRKDFVGRKDYK